MEGNPQEVNKDLTFHRHAYPVFVLNCVYIGKWDVVTFHSWIAHAFVGGLGGISRGWVWLGLLERGRLCSTSSSQGQFISAVMPFPDKGRGLGAQGAILDPLRMEL